VVVVVRRKVITTIVTSLVVLLGITNILPLGTETEIQASGEWDNFDVRTEEPDDITVESMKKVFKKKGKEDSPFYDNMEFIFEQGEEYGLNVPYIVALMAKESGWGLSSLANGLYGYGGIKRQEGKDSSHGRDQSYEGEEDGINAVFELIHRYTTGKINGEELTEIEEIRKVYCPDSDGCIGGYTDSVGNIMEEFGQSPDGGSKKDKVDKSESEYKTDESDYANAKGAELFVKREVGKSGTGIDTKRSMLGGDVYLAILNTNNFIVQMGMYVGVILVGLLLLFTSASLVGYLVISNKGARVETVGAFEKVTGTSLARNRETMVTLIKRWAIVILIIVLFLTGAYVWVMEFVLTMLERFIDYIIKWD